MATNINFAGNTMTLTVLKFQLNQLRRCSNFSSLLLVVLQSVVIAVLLVVVGPAGTTTTNSIAITKLRQ
jgi:hypothetical protein